jgi:hypothetical protein
LLLGLLLELRLGLVAVLLELLLLALVRLVGVQRVLVVPQVQDLLQVLPQQQHLVFLAVQDKESTQLLN